MIILGLNAENSLDQVHVPLLHADCRYTMHAYVNNWQQRVLQKYYYGRSNWQDGTTQFWALIKRYATPSSKIIEIGAGSTNETTRFLSTIGQVTGLDVASSVERNQHVSTAVIFDGTHIPLNTGSFDLAVSNYVNEHVQNPLGLAREICRVLRPGRYYVFRTPNLWHYVSLVAKVTPHGFHKIIANCLRHLPSNADDPYRTYHRMNTKGRCSRILIDAGFTIELIRVIEAEPSYGMVSRLLFYPLMAWERILNSSSFFENLRVNILCVAKKKES